MPHLRAGSTLRVPNAAPDSIQIMEKSPSNRASLSPRETEDQRTNSGTPCQSLAFCSRSSFDFGKSVNICSFNRMASEIDMSGLKCSAHHAARFFWISVRGGIFMTLARCGRFQQVHMTNSTPVICRRLCSGWSRLVGVKSIIASHHRRNSTASSCGGWSWCPGDSGSSKSKSPAA